MLLAVYVTKQTLPLVQQLDPICAVVWSDVLLYRVFIWSSDENTLSQIRTLEQFEHEYKREHDFAQTSNLLVVEPL